MAHDKLIFEALAFDENANISPSLGQSAHSKGKVSEIYIKNAIVSLVSAKYHNPDTCVGLVINVELEDKWKKYLNSYGIITWVCPFKNFSMPKSFVYSLSYYKLCAFDFILKNTEYKKICFLDCDTISVKGYDDIWTECEDSLLIVPNDEPYYAKVRKEINELYSKLYQVNVKTLTHYASGFIIGARDVFKEVLEKCQNVYDRLIAVEGLNASGGDEIVWSLALADYTKKIKSPKAYCLLSFASAKQYWIDKQDYTDENVVMWHLPADKRYSMIWAFNWLDKKGVLPPMEKMAKASRLRHVRTKFNWLSLKAILLDRDAIKRNVKKIFAGE